MPTKINLPITIKSKRVYPDFCFPLGPCQYYTVMNSGHHGHLLGVPLDQVNGMVENLYQDDNGSICGTVRILDTPMGTLLEAMEGVDGYELTPVGVGTVKNETVQDDFKLLYFNLTPMIEFDKKGE